MKFTPEQAKKAQKGIKCIVLLFLQPRRQMGVDGQRPASAAFPPGKENRYPLYRRLGEPHAGLDGWGKSRHHRDRRVRV